MRRQVGTIPKTLETKLEEGDYYEALQLYKSLQSRYLLICICYLIRYEGAGKYKESDELILHGVQNLNKHNQVSYSFLFIHLIDYFCL